MKNIDKLISEFSKYWDDFIKIFPAIGKKIVSLFKFIGKFILDHKEQAAKGAGITILAVDDIKQRKKAKKIDKEKKEMEVAVADKLCKIDAIVTNDQTVCSELVKSNNDLQNVVKEQAAQIQMYEHSQELIEKENWEKNS